MADEDSQRAEVISEHFKSFSKFIHEISLEKLNET